jgi:ribosomal-protein-alanine N-acetyltransferase
VDAILSELVSYTADAYTVRPLGVADAPELFERITSDPVVTRYLPYRTHTDVAQAVDMILAYRDLLQQQPAGYMLGVFDSGSLIGVVGLSLVGHSVAISHKFARMARGSGRRFTRPFGQWIMAHDAVWRMWAHCDAENIAGRRALERTGATFEGVARKYAIAPNISPWPRDCLIFSYCKGDF